MIREARMICFEVNVLEASDELANPVPLVGTVATWRLGYMKSTEGNAWWRTVRLRAAGDAVFVFRLRSFG